MTKKQFNISIIVGSIIFVSTLLFYGNTQTKPTPLDVGGLSDEIYESLLPSASKKEIQEIKENMKTICSKKGGIKSVGYLSKDFNQILCVDDTLVYFGKSLDE